MAEKVDFSDIWGSDHSFGSKLWWTFLFSLTKWYFLLLYVVIVWSVADFFISDGESVGSDNKSKVKTVDCRGSADYEQGLSCGKMTRVMGGTHDPEKFVEQYNYETGRTILRATDCFKVGFKDGLNGVE